MLVLHSMNGIHFADKPPSVSDAICPVFLESGQEGGVSTGDVTFSDTQVSFGFNLGSITDRTVMQKNKYSAVSKFATLSLLVIFISSLLHHDWWQAAGCVVAFELLADLPFIFNGKMWSDEA
jgi:hypothetical protein